MKNIRQKVFETNSSSTHSISIHKATKGLYDSIIPDEDGIIVLTGGTFGWEWEKFNDALTKANYAAIDIEGDSEKENLLKKVICDHTGAKIVKFALDTKNYNSYIDHDSRGTSHEAFKNEKTLKNFLFSPNSWLCLGNDNSKAPDGFYEN